MVAVAAFAALVLVSLITSASRADLSSSYQAGKRRANQLRSQIHAQSNRIQQYQGSVSTLEERLTAIQHSITIQEQQLSDVRFQLGTARTHLTKLEASYARGRRILASELVAEYESPPPTLMNVVVNARGFDDLLNQLSDLRAVERRNTETVRQVNDARIAVTAQAKRLTAIEGRQQRAITTVLVERDNVAQLRLSIVGREFAVLRERGQTASQLISLRKTLTHQEAVLNARAAAAAALSAGPSGGASGGAVAAPGGCANSPFVAHGGSFGFFQAGGTNYSVGEEPIIAARLDQLGRALQLHLIGISGYRSPAHSLEVGGFADDPHTKGDASDTPGVEGVPEATLQKFCLTRPFGGAAEADHIQLS